jgi:hypothetical protein
MILKKLMLIILVCCVAASHGMYYYTPIYFPTYYYPNFVLQQQQQANTFWLIQSNIIATQRALNLIASDEKIEVEKDIKLVIAELIVTLGVVGALFYILKSHRRI